MAFAVVVIGGHQYPVHEAEHIVVPLHVGEPGKKHRRGKKVTVGKFKKKRDYHRTKGHRQDETVLKITRISA